MDIAPRRATRRKVSLTPLIDVVFILLLFFMLASSFSDWTKVELNSGAKAQPASAEGAVLVRVMGADRLELGGAVVTLSEFEKRLAERLASTPDKPVVVQPGDGAVLQRVVQVMDVARRAGARRVTLVGE